jgi:hypothetical protein
VSNDKKSDETKPPAYMIGPGGARAIPVKQLRIPAGSSHVMELPGNAAAKTISDDGLTRGADGLLHEAAPNKPRNKISYLPWLGCFAVECFRPSDGGLASVGPVTMIPREWAQWVPIE